MVSFGTPVDDKLKLDHVVLVLAAGPGVGTAARKALRLAHRRARRLTFLVVANSGLPALDHTCRKLVTTLATEPARALEVRFIVRTGEAGQALKSLLESDSADLVFLASSELNIYATEVGCPVVTLDRTRAYAPLAL